jgi:hypothetical protein
VGDYRRWMDLAFRGVYNIKGFGHDDRTTVLCGLYNSDMFLSQLYNLHPYVV